MRRDQLDEDSESMAQSFISGERDLSFLQVCNAVICTAMQCVGDVMRICDVSSVYEIHNMCFFLILSGVHRQTNSLSHAV